MKDGGGHAFPQVEAIQNAWHKDYGKDRGMTLRDYFAAKALTGLLADSELDHIANRYAELAYALADAMLKARKA